QPSSGLLTKRTLMKLKAVLYLCLALVATIRQWTRPRGRVTKFRSHLFFGLLLLQGTTLILGAKSTITYLRGNQQTRSASTSQLRVAMAYGKLPLSFEANQGQTDSQVKFI